MSNIYDALKHAQQERLHPAGIDPPPLPEDVAPVQPMVLRPLPGLEKEMATLYQAVEGKLTGPSRVVQFISSRHGEGTSTIVREFARVSSSRHGKKVLILDAVVESPSHFRLLDSRSAAGWPDVVTAGIPAEDGVHRVGITSIYVSPCFPGKGGQSKLSDLACTDEFFSYLRDTFDLILVDSSPIDSSSSAASLFRRADGIVFVVEADGTRLPVALRAKETILSCGGDIIGVVLNKRRHHIPDFIYRRL